MKKPILVITFSIFLFLVLPTFNSSTIISVGDSKDPINSSVITSGTETIYWKSNGTVIANETEGQFGFVLCTDGAEGAIIAWVDQRKSAGNEDIYAQRINSNGQTQWPDNGIIVSNATGSQGGSSSAPEIAICTDGNGGAIITWWDDRVDSEGDIYAQRIDSNGQTLWTDNGTVIGNKTTEDLYPEICSDGNMGAIITWQHMESGGTYDIYAQHINSMGQTQWGENGDLNGTIICNDPFGWQEKPQICSDESGGAIITWRDYRSMSNLDIYAQHITSAGSKQWGESGDLNGTKICNEANDQGGSLTSDAEFSICSDGNGGAIITWRDQREGIPVINAEVYAQRINSIGQIQWGENGDLNGTIVGNVYQSEERHPQLCSDGSGGAIITWMRWGGMDYDIYAQRFNSIGEAQWTLNGTAICNENSAQNLPQISIDGRGGAIITWEDFRNAPTMHDIYAQLINSNGQTQWIDNGTLLCNYGTLDQIKPQLSYDGNGGAIIAWRDNRDDPSGDIFVQRIGTPLSKAAPSGGSSSSSSDKAERPIVPGYDAYIIFGAISLMAIILVKKLKKPIKRYKF